MLPPDSRAILRDLLRPPAGTTLVHAVGTTFTIDLTSALAVPLSFAGRDLGENPDPIGVMEAVRRSADRVDIFYQAGAAKVPTQASDALTFLEPVLHPVVAPRPGFLFHPKVWALAYSDHAQQVTYRLLCSTRNLTDDHSWDAIIALDGKRDGEPREQNEPLVRFIGALPSLTTYPIDNQRRARITQLAHELHDVSWELPDDAFSLSFHAFGIGGETPEPDFTGYRRLVVSPFLDPDGLATVAPPTERGTVLVSRAENIDALGAAPEGTDLRVLDAAAELDDDRAAGQLTGLHAKIVVVERNRQAHLFLGSSNATRNAYRGNVEVMVEVVGGPKRYGVDAHLDPESGFGTMLAEYAPQPVGEDCKQEQRFELQNTLRAIARLRWRLRVKATDDRYAVAVCTDAELPETDARLNAELITIRGEAIKLVPGRVADGVFRPVALADITPFLVLTAERDDHCEATVLSARLVGDPDERRDAVLARQVDTPEKFLQFLLLVLGLAGVGGTFEPAAGRTGSSWMSSTSAAVFELLVRALADDPRVLDDLERFIAALARTDSGHAVMPEGFFDLWTTVLDARRRLRATL